MAKFMTGWKRVNKLIRPNKKICMFWVMGLKILGWIGTHIFIFIFSGNKYNFVHLKGISPFKMHNLFCFSRKPEKRLGFTSKFRQGWVTLTQAFFLFGLKCSIVMCWCCIYIKNFKVLKS